MGLVTDHAVLKQKITRRGNRTKRHTKITVNQFMKRPVFRASQLKMNWTQEMCFEIYEKQLRYENLRHTGKETTVVRDRDDYKALVKVRDAQKTARADGEVVTQKVFIPWRRGVRQRSVRSQQQHLQQSQQSQPSMEI